MEEQLADERIEMLKTRARRCRCKYCGGALRVKRLIFSDYEPARVELYCDDCERIEFGVEPEIYRSARSLVDELGFNAYPDLDDNDSTHRMNVAKVCEIMAWENKQLGFLDDRGFLRPAAGESKLVGECLVLEDDDLG